MAIIFGQILTVIVLPLTVTLRLLIGWNIYGLIRIGTVNYFAVLWKKIITTLWAT